MIDPIVGEVYWVTDGKTIQLAECVSRFLKHWQWADGDTFYEFSGKTIAWKHIPRPTVAEVMGELDGEGEER